jgi:hypothetical protein
MWSSYFMLPVISRMTGMLPRSAFFRSDGVSQTFLLGRLGTSILLMSASCVVWDDRYTPLCSALCIGF